MIEIGARYVQKINRPILWEVATVAKAWDGRRHVRLVSVDPPGEHKTIAEAELERNPLFELVK